MRVSWSIGKTPLPAVFAAVALVMPSQTKKPAMADGAGGLDEVNPLDRFNWRLGQ